MTLKSTLGDSPEIKYHNETVLKSIKKKKPKRKIIIEKCYECVESESDDDDQQQKRPLKNINNKCKSIQTENINKDASSLPSYRNKKMIKKNLKKCSIKKYFKEVLNNKKK